MLIRCKGMPDAILHCGSCTDPATGLPAILGKQSVAGVIMVTDPPYTETTDTRSSRRSHTGDLARRISYGSLGVRLRAAIADAAALVEWSAIWDRLEGAYLWRQEIRDAGGVWCGVGTVLQTRGAPRFQGDAPGQRQLGLMIARKKGRVRWRGREWAEWLETRPRSANRRPIVGTRSIETCREVIRDLAVSCSSGCKVVIDPCAGTGVILQAARLEGLQAIGWERDPETYAYAKAVLEGRGDERGQPCLW